MNEFMPNQRSGVDAGRTSLLHFSACSPAPLTADVRPPRTMKHFASLFLLLMLCGCTDTVTKSGLDAKATERAGFTFPDQTYYIGSEGSYDYFVIRRGLGGSTHRCRVPESEHAVTNRSASRRTRHAGVATASLVSSSPTRLRLLFRSDMTTTWPNPAHPLDGGSPSLLHIRRYWAAASDEQRSA